MEQLMSDIVKAVRERGELGARELERIIASHNRRFREPVKHFAKKQLSPAYQRIKREDASLWESWKIDGELERALLATIQMKPRRTASGVATITVITKPHPCAGDCLYCPSDVRMPKSYLHDEPACQRAERTFFDPYLQVASRLSALERMGHAIDKIELIVLGGSFTDYPASYQTWFVHELFRALNDADGGIEDVGDVFSDFVPIDRGSILARNVHERLAAYRSVFGLDGWDPTGHAGDGGISAHLAACASWQRRVESGDASYSDAVEDLYGPKSTWQDLPFEQTATLEALESAHTANEGAAHRVVGLVVETRPDAANAKTLTLLRQLGCTKLQMGVQTLDEQVAARCKRPTPLAVVRESFELARAFGFKSHAHFMANLPGANPHDDRDDYRSFVCDPCIAPDEVKLYPCVLLASSRLAKEYAEGRWCPYSEEDLVALLAEDVLATPGHTRISRMIRDFSSGDIVAGNKKTNLRQMVEQRVAEMVARGADPVREIRMREVSVDRVERSELRLEEHAYATSNSTEHFLEWVADPDDDSPVANRIAGFLRLSLPDRSYVAAHADDLPIGPGEAMIREVHVYGAVARLHAATTGAQHQGLGSALIARACELARNAGYERINVISAVGTRAYYRNLGFEDAGLYLQRQLT